MKKAIFFSVMLAFIIAGFTQKNLKSSLQGAWKFAGYTVISGDTVRNYTSTETLDQVKMWTANHFSFTGKEKKNGTDHYGCGTYTLNGKDYTERIIFHYYKPLINQEYKAIIEIRGDTLYQTTHSDSAYENGVKTGSYTITEKYIKLN